LDIQKLPTQQEIHYSLSLKVGKANALFTLQKSGRQLELSSDIKATALGFSLFQFAQKAIWTENTFAPQSYEEADIKKKRKKIWRCEDKNSVFSAFENGQQTKQNSFELTPMSSEYENQRYSFLDPLSLICALQCSELKIESKFVIQVMAKNALVFLELSFSQEKISLVKALHREPSTQLRLKIKLLSGEVGPSFSVINEGLIQVWVDQPTGIISEFGGQYGSYSLGTGYLEKYISS